MWFGAMMLSMVAFWAGVIVLAVWLAGKLFPRVPETAVQSPHEILKSRYARGELTGEHYQETLKELS